MVLVPENALERLQQRQKVNTAPLTARLNVLDHTIQDVLKSDELTEDEKVRQYSQTLQNYLTYYQQRKGQPINVKLDQPLTIKQTAPVEKPQEPQEEHIPEVLDTVERDILSALPKSLKSRGKLLIDKIRENPEVMKWDNRGQLIFEDQPLPGSHIVDLVGDILRDRKGTDPVGWEVFTRGLAKMNAPETFVRNERRRNALREFKSGTGNLEAFLPTPPPSGRTPGPIRPVHRTRNTSKQMRQRWLTFGP